MLFLFQQTFFEKLFNFFLLDTFPSILLYPGITPHRFLCTPQINPIALSSKLSR